MNQRTEQPAVRRGPIIGTAAGKVQGAIKNGIHSFRGIPYGASTAGANRYGLPQPVAPWSGVRPALEYGFDCVQNLPNSPAAFKWYYARLPQGEDCLHVSVYTPGAGDNEKRPVMVWLHGAGYYGSSGSGPAFEGSNLARHGDVVVVTVTHRIGVLGFLYLEQIDPSFAESTNVGMLDIVAALQWVRDNIAAFGGDANNVTIFGQSGGASKTSVMQALPAAKGLFHKAIMQSGGSTKQATPEKATQLAREVLANLGLKDSEAHKVRELPAEKLLAAITATGQAITPVVDGRVLPRHSYSPDAPVISADVPLLIGTTRTETSRYLGNDTANLAVSYEDMRKRIAAHIGLDEPQAESLIKAYAATRPGATPYQLMVTISTDTRFRAAMIQTAELKSAAQHGPVYMYQVTWPTPGQGGLYVTPHNTCIPMVFRNLEVTAELTGTGAAAQALSEVMSSTWVQFARAGNPNNATLPAWKPYDAATRATMMFDTTCAVANDPLREDRLALLAHPPVRAGTRSP